MMREIKFRAWFKNENEIKKVAINNIYEGNRTHLHLSPMPLSDYRPIELMQYTGLKDKNDQEIYEGDILKEYYEGEPDILVVSFEDGCFMVRQINTPNADYTLNGCDLGNTLVIGNIYENPELLEGVNV